MRALIIVFCVIGALCQAQSVNNFALVKQVDPLTDEDTSYIYALADETSLQARPTIYIQCAESSPDGIQLSYAPDEFLTTHGAVQVQYRFDDKPASEVQFWSYSSTGTSAYAGLEERSEFLAEAKQSTQVIMRASDYQEVPYTYAFNLKGLTESLLALGCYKTVDALESNPPNSDQSSLATVVRYRLTSIAREPSEAYTVIVRDLGDLPYTEGLNIIYAPSVTIQFEKDGNWTNVLIEGSDQDLAEKLAQALDMNGFLLER